MSTATQRVSGRDHIARAVFQEELQLLEARNQKQITEVIQYLKNRIEEITIKEKNGVTNGKG